METLSVSAARQQLMRLAKHVYDHMDHIILTNRGRSETVLLSLAEYRSLKAAAELINHPEALAATKKGFAQLAAGQGVSLEDAFAPPKPSRVAAASSAR